MWLTWWMPLIQGDFQQAPRVQTSTCGHSPRRKFCNLYFFFSLLFFFFFIYIYIKSLRALVMDINVELLLFAYSWKLRGVLLLSQCLDQNSNAPGCLTLQLNWRELYVAILGSRIYPNFTQVSCVILLAHSHISFCNLGHVMS